ncbi:MAG: hypothetical protein ACLFTB_02445 [Desulfovibrionales bacterium]
MSVIVYGDTFTAMGERIVSFIRENSPFDTEFFISWDMFLTRIRKMRYDIHFAVLCLAVPTDMERLQKEAEELRGLRLLIIPFEYTREIVSLLHCVGPRYISEGVSDFQEVFVRMISKHFPEVNLEADLKPTILMERVKSRNST